MRIECLVSGSIATTIDGELVYLLEGHEYDIPNDSDDFELFQRLIEWGWLAKVEPSEEVKDADY